MFGKTHDIEGRSDDAQAIADTFGLDLGNCISIIDEDFSNIPANVPDTTGCQSVTTRI